MNLVRKERQGQNSVETMLFTSVIVIAIVSAMLIFTEGPNGFIEAMIKLSQGAATVYVNPSASGDFPSGC